VGCITGCVRPKGAPALPHVTDTRLNDEEPPVRRVPIVLVTALLTAGGMAAVVPAASAVTDITPQHLWIYVTDLGSEHRSCRIDADLYVPPGATAQNPAPAILATNGFGGTKTDQADLAQGMGERGYVTLSYTGLGFVDKDTCPITLDDREHDGAAASQLLRFLGGDPNIQAVDQASGQAVHVDQVIRDDGPTGTRHDPAVGMVGGSYGGQIQFATAAYEQEQGTKRLDAIVPMITWNDLSYSLDPNNQLPQQTASSGSVSSDVAGAFKYEWSLFFTSVGVVNGIQDLSPETFQAYTQQVAATQNCGNFEPQVCQALIEVGTQGYPSAASIAYLRHASVTSYIQDVTVPTFLAQGQADSLFNLQESVATYTKLKAQGTPVALDWQSWGHSNLTPVAGELDQRHPAASYQGRQLIAWFDHYVRRTAPQPPLTFNYFRDWVFTTSGDISAAYASAPAFPIGNERTYYLSGADLGGATVAGTSSGDGALVTRSKDVVPGTSSYTSSAPYGPNYSETSALESTISPEPPVSDPPTTSIRFSTAPLTKAMTVVGSPRLTVQLDSPTVAATQGAGPGGELVLFAKVYDIGPNGAVELPRRLISPVRVADVTRPVTIELPGIVHQFAQGHRLAIVLAGGDMAYRGATDPQPVTLTTGGTFLQRLTVPNVG
jgi:ABC-2 type transport system ATP-binding protein